MGMDINKKKKILILNGQYLPGFKGGGPIQSCANMVENLSDYFQFYILTSDRDFKSNQEYSNVKINEWNEVGSAKVFYMSIKNQRLLDFYKVINSIEFDIMYLNGFFSPIFTIKPLILRLLGMLSVKKVILTPRGDFTGGCENKKLKKYSYIYFSKIIGLYNNLIWHATSKIEEEDIKSKFKKAKIFTIPNLSAKYSPRINSIEKEVGQLRIVFISRIFPKKNLKFALKVLKKITNGKVIFDIYGPMEDKDYWKECEEEILELPSNVVVTYKGEVPHSKIGETFSNYHVFLFPTLGENYGHVIVESLMNNCLVILSKGVTPWDDYNDVFSSVLELDNENKFVEVINKLILTNDNQFKALISSSNLYISSKLKIDDIVAKYKSYFDN